MARRWRAAVASPSMGDSGDDSDAIGQATQTSRASKRLEQTQGSLEAEYAVLSEASTQSAALEAMLRNSQPLLWLDNALVLQREKPRTLPIDPKKGAQRRHQPITAAKPTASVPDDELLWDELFMESELRRRRRIQWEVAKRIARVEREISRQPVAQRSWHVRERKRLQEEERRRQEEQLTREKQQRQQERDERLRASKEEKVNNRDSGTKRVGFVAREPRELTAKEATKLPPAPPTKVADVDLDFEWSSKPVKLATVRHERTPEDAGSDSGSDNDKENTVSERLPPGETEASPVVAKASAEMEGARLMEIVRESLETPIAQTASPPQKKPGELKVDARPLMTDFDVDSAAEELHPHGHSDVGGYGRGSAQVGTHNASSLGRQVLSEHRTMAMSVSFGAPAIEGARLSSDVLRRLFSDLDADRDGRLNRIETCMALYRLHIEVPAPRIVAFFKRIHAVESETTQAGSRRQRERGNKRVSTYEPLKELINYKQFVAFVTTAFEQQRQRRAQRMKHPESVRAGGSSQHVVPIPPIRIPRRLEAASPVIVPSRLMDGHQGIPTAPRVRADQQSDEHERRLVEQRDDGDEAEDVTDRVLRQIPDYLMARALASVDSPPKQVQQLVRSSLEKIGQRKLEDKIVEDVTRDLVREFAQKLLTIQQAGGFLPDGDNEDTSGLRRAAAYFDTLVTGEHDEDSSRIVGGDFGMQDWWKVLTEEQIAALVQNIWRQRQLGLTSEPPDEEEENEDTAPNIPLATPEEARTVRDENTDKLKVVATVQRVAEKSIQTGSGDFVSIPWQRPPSPPPPPPPPPSPPPEEVALSSSLPQQEKENVPPTVRSTLAQKILTSGNFSSRVQRRERPIGSRPKEVLTELRRQRRRRQVAAPVATSWESASTADSLPVTERPPVLNELLKQTRNSTPTPVQATTIITNVQEAAPSPTQVVDMAPSPLPVREVRVRSPAEGPAIPNASIPESTRWSCSSSNDVLSSYSSSLGSTMNLFREMSGDDVWRYAAQRRRERLRRRGRYKSGSHSVHESSDADGDLSDGEIVRDRTHDDLSDGELFGGTRRKVVRAKNYRAADFRQPNESDCGSEVAGGSLESGEMLPSMMTMYQNYQQQILRASASSLESGEAEDGAVGFIDNW